MFFLQDSPVRAIILNVPGVLMPEYRKCPISARSRFFYKMVLGMRTHAWEQVAAGKIIKIILK